MLPATDQSSPASEQVNTHNWKVEWVCRKWADTADYEAGNDPDDVVVVAENVLCTAGITRMLNLLAGAGGTAFNATNTRIGVGNGSTAATAADTDLAAAAGSSNRQFKLVSGAPTVLTNTIAYVAAFGDAVANFVWAEFGIDNGTADGTTVVAPLFNRKVSALGTKASGTWTLTVTITIT